MGLFSRKPTVRAADFCRAFYERAVFAAPIGGADPHIVFAEVAHKLVSEADPAFRAVDVAQLAHELVIMRLEVIGVVWALNTSEKLALLQTDFTKSYLADMGRNSWWEEMLLYNKAVARSATHGADPKTPIGRARITFVNTMRISLFKALEKGGRDGEAVARVVNRLGLNGKWSKGVTRGYIAMELMVRLGCPHLNEEAGFRVAAQVEGSYRGAAEALAEVRLTE